MASIAWFALGILLVFLEFLIGDLSMLMVAGGALAAAGVSLTDTPLWVDVIVFAVTTIGLMGLVRPALRRKMFRNDDSERVESNPRQLAGRSAAVEEAVTADSGMVRLGGELWSARALVAGTEFTPGDRVTVVSIDGNTAVVDKEV
ncbi:NfeD family protein [uncultured Corynebacterium sp.]|uniref:NfeD family protein n=1 Tax=uncultured Corynebacterium sp. TaxID=159447 RepID=UPI0025DAD0D3|nr:NfeD family protein [uncultured Corynebacterium sp.]